MNVDDWDNPDSGVPLVEDDVWYGYVGLAFLAACIIFGVIYLVVNT